MKSCLYHKLTGARPGFSFPMGAVSKSGLKLAVLTASSPFLDSAGTFIHVLWDWPAEQAERRLCGDGPWRRGGEMAKERGVEKPPQIAMQG